MSRRSLRVAVLGATGLVGRTMLRCLEESGLPVEELRPLCSPRSAGKEVAFRGGRLAAAAVSAESFIGVDLALFSAGAEASDTWAPIAVQSGAWVIDNSSRWRMDPSVPLIVPEVNPDAIPAEAGIIANPNCSTIQLVAALHPLHVRYGLRKVVLATYQAASGKGETGRIALDRECRGEPAGDAFPGPLLGNVLPQCDTFLDDGFTREEEKTILETRRILGIPGLPVHPTCVRVPVYTGHCEAVYIETVERPTIEGVREALGSSPAIRILDDPAGSCYPTPLQAAGTDPVWVGRIRMDRCEEHGVHLWVVADNLRKGAALNAVQIAHLIWERGESAP